MRRLRSRCCSVVAGVTLVGLLVATHEGMAAGAGGTAEEAKAMLERAVASIKADEATALAAFTAGTDGFPGTATCTGAAAVWTMARSRPMAPTPRWWGGPSTS